MVAQILQPLNLIVFALGAGFLIPLISRRCEAGGRRLFWLVLLLMAAIPAFSLREVLSSGVPMAILTAGVAPPLSINLQFGAYEGVALLFVNLAALLGAISYPKLRALPGAMVLYLILLMGIDGMVMTRDLFNLFIFIEISAIASYVLIGFERNGAVLSAGFKYLMATSLASAFFLLGTTFLYYQTGTLNIDDMVAQSDLIRGPIGVVASVMLLFALLLELKPFPANGWGLDVYQSAPNTIAVMISVGVSSGMLFALYKLMPLFLPLQQTVMVVAGATFLFSNLVALKQKNVKRLLGYSSIGQVGLIALAIAALFALPTETTLALVAGGLFVNHLLAKAGLFWLAGIVDRERIGDWSGLKRQPLLMLLFALLLLALLGLPPFPGFWAKWQLVMALGEADRLLWVGLILFGSLLEAAYLFRWFITAMGVDPESEALPVKPNLPGLSHLAITTLLLFVAGLQWGWVSGVETRLLYLPLTVAVLLLMLERLPGGVKGPLALGLMAGTGYWQVVDLQGITALFGLLLVGGGLVTISAGLYRHDSRPGYYPLLALLLLSMGGLLKSEDALSFFFNWELITVSSFFLIAQGREARPHLLTYLLFSLAAALFILAGFGVAYGATGSILLTALGQVGQQQTLVFSLLAIGFLIKAGGFGLHIWLPGAYAESDDDFTATLSAVVSKVSIFGLLMVAAYLGMESSVGLDPTYILGWIGTLMAVFGALMAVFQEDMKKLLAYSSMGQLGYVIVATALMSHLGWVSALYIAINHLLFKTILFLAIAGVIYRTGTRLMYKTGGLIANMPFSFVSVMIGIIAVSGVPPLTGFGGKWMLFNALMEKQWFYMAAVGFFASAVAFLYLFRLIYTVFLGQRKHEHRELTEAPTILLIPQYLFIIAIMVLSAYPKLLLDPLSAMVDPYFANTLVWQGSALKTALGNWNAPMIMMLIGAVWVVPLLVLMLLSRSMKIQKVKQFNIVYAAERPHTPQTTHFAYDFYAHYDAAVGFLVRPRATAFWRAMSEWTHSVASVLRRIYTGNGQSYLLFILLLFIAIYFANRGAF